MAAPEQRQSAEETQGAEVRADLPGLSDSQQAGVMLAAGVLYAVSLTTIPSVVLGQLPIWVPAVLAVCGGISQALKEFAGGKPAQQQAILDILQRIAALTPEERKTLMDNLATLLPLIGVVLPPKP